MSSDATLRAGRPRRGTKSLDEVIIEYLMYGEEEATWKSLKEVMPGGGRKDSSLKKVIDRLVKAKQIVPDAVLRQGKAVTIYRYAGDVPTVIADGKPIRLFVWISDTCRELAAAKTDWSRNADGRRGKAGTLEEAQVPPADLLERQGAALVIAMETLKLIILDEINTSYWTDSEDERNQYLEAACRIYLSVIIKEIALLAHPAHGDLKSAIRIAKGERKGIGSDKENNSLHVVLQGLRPSR